MAEQYEIRLNGRLDDGWSVWFEGMEIEPQANGTTLLSGPVADQATLHGLLAMGLLLLAVRRLED
jgi:hypothetical protein